jgi:transmembrane sensor
MKESLIKALLFDFFDGKATSMQRKLIEEWLSDRNNQETYYHCLNQWESEHPQFSPGFENAFENYQSLLSGRSSEPQISINKTGTALSLQLKTWMWVAAAAWLLLTGTFVFRKQILYKSYNCEAGKTASYRLSDGTHVTLNSNSELRVPRFGFANPHREVVLSGEAEFNVTHTENNDRFVVNMNDEYQIEVLGTEFVAFSRARGKRVFLKHGKVKLTLPEGKQLYMKPGNLFVATPNGKFEVSERADPRPYVAWKDQTFYFNSTLLSDVALQINERFDVNVRIQDTLLANRKIAGIYKAEQADDLLQILSELMQIEITQKEDYIELSTPKLP